MSRPGGQAVVGLDRLVHGDGRARFEGDGPSVLTVAHRQDRRERGGRRQRRDGVLRREVPDDRPSGGPRHCCAAELRRTCMPDPTCCAPAEQGRRHRHGGHSAEDCESRCRLVAHVDLAIRAVAGAMALQSLTAPTGPATAAIGCVAGVPEPSRRRRRPAGRPATRWRRRPAPGPGPTHASSSASSPLRNRWQRTPPVARPLAGYSRERRDLDRARPRCRAARRTTRRRSRRPRSSAGGDGAEERRPGRPRRA